MRTISMEFEIINACIIRFFILSGRILPLIIIIIIAVDIFLISNPMDECFIEMGEEVHSQARGYRSEWSRSMCFTEFLIKL